MPERLRFLCSAGLTDLSNQIDSAVSDGKQQRRG